MQQTLCYNLLMIRQLSLIFSLIFIVSCANEEQPTEQDAKDFLAEVQLRAETEGPVIYSASWISSNFITYDSQVVLADFSKRYTLKSLELQTLECVSFREVSKYNLRVISNKV